MIHVMLIDDHALIRQGFRVLLNEVNDMTVVADVASVAEATDGLVACQPQVVILNQRQFVTSFPETMQALLALAPKTAVLVLANSDDNSAVMSLFSLGVLGYLDKNIDIEGLLLAIRKVAQGQRYVSPNVAKRLAINHLGQSKKVVGDSPFRRLSRREMACSILLIQGKPVCEIAQLMAVKVRTVNSYRCRIFQKLQVSGDVDLIRLASRHDVAVFDHSC